MMNGMQVARDVQTTFSEKWNTLRGMDFPSGRKGLQSGMCSSCLGWCFPSGLMLPVWAGASCLRWSLLFALVTSCHGGGAFQLAEKLPVWSQGFLFELRLAVWAGAPCLGGGTFHLGWGSRLGWSLLSWLGASCLRWDLQY